MARPPGRKTPGCPTSPPSATNRRHPHRAGKDKSRSGNGRTACRPAVIQEAGSRESGLPNRFRAARRISAPDNREGGDRYEPTNRESHTRDQPQDPGIRRKGVQEQEHLYRVLDDIHQKRGIAAVIHGAARGADSLAGDWAHSRGIPVEAYPVTPEEWRAIGRSAGIRRNEKMLKEGRLELAVGFPGNTGTKHMARIAAQSGLPTLRVTTTGHVAVPPGANRLPPKEDRKRRKPGTRPR